MKEDELKELLKQFPDALINELDGTFYMVHLAPHKSNPVSNELRKKLIKDAK
jgi:hypothetical protein